LKKCSSSKQQQQQDQHVQQGQQQNKRQWQRFCHLLALQSVRTVETFENITVAKG
jgi:hypothetical protein